jgi:hypothetical protein
MAVIEMRNPDRPAKRRAIDILGVLSLRDALRVVEEVVGVEIAVLSF